MVSTTAGVTAGRRFGLSDGMILMVGMAVALSGGLHLVMLMAWTFVNFCRDVSAHVGDLPGLPSTFWDAVHDDLRNTLWYGSQVAEAGVIGFTPALLIVRLRRPRPSWRDLIRQPGVVACFALVFGFFWVNGALVGFFPRRFEVWGALPTALGGTVAVAWVVLALSRRWRSEPGWIDRSGRVLGWVAIGLAVCLPLIHRI